MEYKKEHGHCQVPQKYEANLQLGEWVIQVSLLICSVRIRACRINIVSISWGINIGIDIFYHCSNAKI
jgi:hypothetical protein